MIKLILSRFDDEELIWITLTETEERKFVDEVLDELFREHGLHVLVKYEKEENDTRRDSG